MSAVLEKMRVKVSLESCKVSIIQVFGLILLRYSWLTLNYEIKVYIYFVSLVS